MSRIVKLVVVLTLALTVGGCGLFVRGGGNEHGLDRIKASIPI